MSRHLFAEVERLKRTILAEAGIVEQSVQLAVRSIQKRDREMALRVISGDDQIDQLEVEIEEECLKILALHQPVSTDLRFIVAVLKINNELERMGDLAVKLAERSAFLATQPAIEIPFDLSTMSEKASDMLKRSLDSIVYMDLEQARSVLVLDNEVDAINRQAYVEVEKRIRLNLDHLDRLLHYLSVSRQIERIADLATNIAEDVIYTITGQIVRHQHLGDVPGMETPV